MLAIATRRGLEPGRGGHATPVEGNTLQIFATNFHKRLVSFQGLIRSNSGAWLKLALTSAHQASGLQRRRTMSSDSRPLHAMASLNPPALGLRALDLRRAYLSAVISLRPQPAVSSPAPIENRPQSLEGLLVRASELLAGIPAQDPRSRLLQTALLRRDHALLAAVVRSYGAVSIATPIASRPAKSQSTPPKYRAIRTSERPTYRPPRRIAAE